MSKKKEVINKSRTGLLFGQVCRTRRNALGFSLDDIAKEAGLGMTYYRAIEVGAFNPHTSKARAFAKAFQWDPLATSFILSILSEVAVERGVCKTPSEKNTAEQEVRIFWSGMYTEFSFLKDEDSSLEKLGNFLILGFKGMYVDYKSEKFFKDNPGFLKNLNEFSKIYSFH